MKPRTFYSALNAEIRKLSEYQDCGELEVATIKHMRAAFILGQQCERQAVVRLLRNGFDNQVQADEVEAISFAKAASQEIDLAEPEGTA